MSEPREPPQTCPEIDRAQADLEETADQLRSIAEDIHSTRLFSTIAGSLEGLRGLNDDLRVWGSHWKERADELEAECEGLSREVEELKSQAVES